MNGSSTNGLKVYAVISASALLVMGILGFVFTELEIPVYVLLINLVLGVWGVFASFKK